MGRRAKRKFKVLNLGLDTGGGGGGSSLQVFGSNACLTCAADSAIVCFSVWFSRSSAHCDAISVALLASCVRNARRCPRAMRAASPAATAAPAAAARPRVRATARDRCGVVSPAPRKPRGSSAAAVSVL